MFIVQEEICEHGETFYEELSQLGCQNMQELFLSIFINYQLIKTIFSIDFVDYEIDRI